ncbi:40S ribosomal protein S8 [Morella rubra]|uniref:40S ribosomal protein S8 n=1 Tax=Morella rubra TaxID=262757 RepID=A0A6A1V9W2_9ROSI|nr:40S ribosomal protein S8 [Morella rubra]
MAFTSILSKKKKIKRKIIGGHIDLVSGRNTGNYSWGSEAVTRKTRLLDVVYNASNNELVRTQNLVKSAIVQVDTAPFKQGIISSTMELTLVARRILQLPPRKKGRGNFSVKMSSDSLPPPPENCIVVGCGGATVDYLAAVVAYPEPDDKIRTTSLKVQGGGNVGNALTCVARLGLKPRLISKVADDTPGRGILEELEADGVDTSFFVVSEGGNSPFTYIIVDNQTKTRTCIHTPGYPPMIPNDLSQASLLSALDGARIVYFDGRLHETASIVAQEAGRRIPILVDAERAWTDGASIPSAIVSILLRLPNIKFVIVTLGGDGCIMLERSVSEDSQAEEIDIDILVESLKRQKDESISMPTYISSSVTRLRANGIGIVFGRLFLGTAEKIPPSELIDTTGAGDAFIGAVIYALCANMPPERMLPFAAQVAAAKCRGLGARTALPPRSHRSTTGDLSYSSEAKIISSAK